MKTAKKILNNKMAMIGLFIVSIIVFFGFEFNLVFVSISRYLRILGKEPWLLKEPH